MHSTFIFGALGAMILTEFPGFICVGYFWSKTTHCARMRKIILTLILNLIEEYQTITSSASNGQKEDIHGIELNGNRQTHSL